MAFHMLKLIHNLYVDGDLCRLQVAHALYADSQKL